MTPMQRLPLEAPRFQPADRMIVDDNVRPGDEPIEDLATRRVRNVEGNAAFAGVQVKKEAASFGVRLVVRKRAAPTRRIAVRQLLDLHDVGAHVRQKLTAIRSGDHAAQLDDLDAVERASRHRSPFTQSESSGSYSESKEERQRAEAHGDGCERHLASIIARRTAVSRDSCDAGVT